MEDEIKIIYKTFDVKFNEAWERWDLYVDNIQQYGNESLKKVKEYIDKMLKEDFVRFDGYVDRYDKGFVQGTVTSQDGEGRYWITLPSGRQKESRIYLKNPKNDDLIKKISNLRMRILALSQEKQTLERSMDYVGR